MVSKHEDNKWTAPRGACPNYTIHNLTICGSSWFGSTLKKTAWCTSSHPQGLIQTRGDNVERLTSDGMCYKQNWRRRRRKTWQLKFKKSTSEKSRLQTKSLDWRLVWISLLWPVYSNFMGYFYLSTKDIEIKKAWTVYIYTYIYNIENHNTQAKLFKERNGPGSNTV